MPFCLQKRFSREISNMRVFLDQLSLQVQLPDLENLFVSFMSTVDMTSGYGPREFQIEIT